VFKVPKYKTFVGSVRLKGDKSISHRVLIFSSLCKDEETKVYNLGLSDDIIATIGILKNLGVYLEDKHDFFVVRGKGLYFDEPSDILYAYESGTTARIFCSVLASQRFSCVIDGKEALRKRPMRRVVDPLRKIGAKIWGREDGNNLPLLFDGIGRFRGGQNFDIPVSSAQVKTALLISNFWSDGPVGVKEPSVSRDHTERILPAFSVDIRKDESGYIYAVGVPKSPKSLNIPGDISSASFLIAISILFPNSEIIIRDVSLNPTRMGFIHILQKMGAKIQVIQKDSYAGEPYGDIFSSTSDLKNLELHSDIIPKIVDEIPILSVCALFGEGVFIVKDAKELRFKETDRINAICSNFRALGVDVQEFDDGFAFEGLGRDAIHRLSAEYSLKTFSDHRIAMSLFVLGLVVDGIVYLDDINCISKSYPDFISDVQALVR